MRIAMTPSFSTPSTMPLPGILFFAKLDLAFRFLFQVSSLQKSVQCGTGVCQDQVNFFPCQSNMSDLFLIPFKNRSIIFLIFGLIVLGIGIGITGENIIDHTCSNSVFSGNPTLRGREGGTVRRLRRRLPGGGPPPPPQPLLLCHEDQPDRGAHLEHHRGLLRASQNALPFIILFLAKSRAGKEGVICYTQNLLQ